MKSDISIEVTHITERGGISFISRSRNFDIEIHRTYRKSRRKKTRDNRGDKKETEDFLCVHSFLISDSKFHIFELVNSDGIHDIEVVFSGGKSFWDFYSGNLIVYDIEFRIFENEVITELNGYNLIETISLNDDEPILVILYGFRRDIRDIDNGTGVFKGEAMFRGQDFAVFEGKEYEVFTAIKSVSIYLDKENTIRINRTDAFLSDIYKLDAVEILSAKSDEVIDIGIISGYIQSYTGWFDLRNWH